MGLPTDPLPDPIALASDDGDVAGMLAQTVATGGNDALAALVTALSKSGFAIYGPDGMVAVRPEGADQGFFLEAWQVRSMLGAVGPRKHVSVPIGGLAAGVLAAVPSLKDEPIAQFLVDGIVESAQSDDPSLRVWARFIIELGKLPHSYPSYDLLARPDVNTVHFDAIQLALIARRLAADLAAAVGANLGTEAPRTGWFFLPIVYADEPCVPTGVRPTPRATRSAFGQLMRTITAPGRAINRAVSPSIENWLDYQNLALMFSALKVDVEMEGGPPLRRTKTTAPGEPRKIRAMVSLDGVPLEWVNCYRAWLNSRGRELRDIPRSNGPVPNVAVEFDLDGQAIVRIPLSAPAEQRGLPGGTKTDDQGIARLAVEGVPQDRDLREPAREQRRTAAVKVSATVKASDLLTRSHPTEGIASTDFVHEWVTEQEFTIDVPYRFEVIDWSDTPGRWTGTITVVDTAIITSSGEGPFDRAATSWQQTETTEVSVQVTETTGDDSTGGSLHASMKGRIQGRYNRQKTFAGWTLNSCGSIKNRRMNNTSREAATGSGEGDSSITVSVFDDGRYLIAASPDELVMPVTGRVDSELEVLRTRGQDCYVDVKTDGREFVPTQRTIGGLIQAAGTIDPQNVNVLKGSTTEEKTPASPTPGGTAKWVKTTTWELQRH
jgi:hypothetical protein